MDPRGVTGIEQNVTRRTGERLGPVDERITIRQRRSIGFATIAKDRHRAASGKLADTALAFLIGGLLMVCAGAVELLFGVPAERQSLEDVAKPLTAADTTPSQALLRHRIPRRAIAAADGVSGDPRSRCS